ncbi:hypothetical protein [Pseudonocardia alaniniphila]|uniref:Uncharacterized protein n=1 Tax=Pseudonocardia alaniniphila TaxID=75291 RepID=A0ABS9THV0_9PSEU|nr:hypothetical protein [Pseudonocardia alaniniphila]MCH6168130.1 hypothetical protein [Pseudonocardia alaniniphila]
MRSTIRILLAAAVGAAVVASGGAVFTLATPSPTPAAATQAVAAPKPSPRAAAAPAAAAEAPAPAVAAPAPVAAPVVEAVEQRASAATERVNRSVKRQQQDVVLRKPAVRSEADAPSRRAEPAPQRPTAKASAPAKPRAAESESAERKKPERSTAARKPSLDDARRVEERLRKIVVIPRTDDDERRTVGRLIDGITRPVLGTCERLPVVGGLACGGGGLLTGVTRSGGIG